MNQYALQLAGDFVWREVAKEAADASYMRGKPIIVEFHARGEPAAIKLQKGHDNQQAGGFWVLTYNDAIQKGQHFWVLVGNAPVLHSDRHYEVAYDQLEEWRRERGGVIDRTTHGE